MDSKVRICPQCGAHVMAGDNVCPRCDHRLDDATDIFPPLGMLDDSALDFHETVPELELPDESGAPAPSAEIEPYDDVTEIDLAAAGPGDESEDWDAATYELPAASPVAEVESEPEPPETDESETWEDAWDVDAPPLVAEVESEPEPPETDESETWEDAWDVDAAPPLAEIESEPEQAEAVEPEVLEDAWDAATYELPTASPVAEAGSEPEPDEVSEPEDWGEALAPPVAAVEVEPDEVSEPEDWGEALAPPVAAVEVEPDEVSEPEDWGEALAPPVAAVEVEPEPDVSGESLELDWAIEMPAVQVAPDEPATEDATQIDLVAESPEPAAGAEEKPPQEELPGAVLGASWAAFAQATTAPEISVEPDEPTVARVESEIQALEDAPAIGISSRTGPGSPPEAVRIPSEERTPRRQSQPGYIIPPAPYTPPPPLPQVVPPATLAPPPAPMAAYAVPSEGAYNYSLVAAVGFMQQRVNAYRQAGYHLISQGPYEATLARGKPLGVGGCLLALVSIIGALWYGLIVALSGFHKDRAYLMLEADGRVYEDGPGAAHVRRARWRAGRRWGIVGAVVFIVSLVMAVGLLLVMWMALSRYKPELREAYPEVTLFEDSHSSEAADPDDVRMVEDGAVVWSILAGITVVGLWGGLTLFVIGLVHAAAYHTRVPPLPGSM